MNGGLRKWSSVDDIRCEGRSSPLRSTFVCASQCDLQIISCRLINCIYEIFLHNFIFFIYYTN